MSSTWGKNPPARGTRRYERMVRRGCGSVRIDTDWGTEYDCDFYDWECDNCPPCVEEQRRKPTCRKIATLPTLEGS